MYSSDLRLRPLYIYMFSENFRGLPQPHQANTGLLLQSTMTTSCCTLCKWSTVKLSCAARVETLNIIEVSWFSRDGLGLRRSVGSLSLRRPGFDPRPFHMSLVMHIMAAEIDFFFPEYQSTKSPYSSLSTCSFYQRDNQEKLKVS